MCGVVVKLKTGFYMSNVTRSGVRIDLTTNISELKIRSTKISAGRRYEILLIKSDGSKKKIILTAKKAEVLIKELKIKNEFSEIDLKKIGSKRRVFKLMPRVAKKTGGESANEPIAPPKNNRAELHRRSVEKQARIAERSLDLNSNKQLPNLVLEQSEAELLPLPDGEQPVKQKDGQLDKVDVPKTRKQRVEESRIKRRESMIKVNNFTQQIMKKHSEKNNFVDEENIQSHVARALNEISKSEVVNSSGEKVAIYTHNQEEYRARITKSKSGEDKLVILKRRVADGPVAEGSFGKLYKFEKVHSVGFRAIKQAKTATDTTIKKEFQMQSYLGKLAHVQKPAKNLINNANTGLWEYEGHFYADGDVDKFIEDLKKDNVVLTPKKLTNCINMIKNGIRELHKKGVGHFDIKGANFLVENGEFFVADLGGAKKVLEDPDRVGSFSPLYSLHEDYIHIQAHEEQDAELMRSQGKRDVYSAGLIAFQLATKTNTDMLEALFDKMVAKGIVEDSNTGVKVLKPLSFLNLFKNELIKSGVDDENRELILKMIDPNIKKRPALSIKV